MDFLTSDLATTILSKLGSLIAEEVIITWGLKGDLDSLRERVELLSQFLSDAESKSKSTDFETVRIWLEQLKKEAQGADNFLDEMKYMAIQQKVESHNVVRKFFSKFPDPRIAHRVKRINRSLDAFCKKGEEINILKDKSEIVLAASKPDVQAPPSVDISKIVGREAEKEEIIERLCRTDDVKGLPIVAVVGMGGLGKTALAQVIYNDKRVKEHFGKRIWFTVSNEFDPMNILKGMIQSLTQKATDLSNIEPLIDMIKKEVDKKKFLLVLDDVWNEDLIKWNMMEDSLMGIDGQNGSKVLITTRKQQSVLMRNSKIYSLKSLSDEDSWSIFKGRAFAVGGVEETKVFVDLGRRLVKKCGGVPLAITVLGGLLHLNSSEAYRKAIVSNPLWITLSADKVICSLKISCDHLQPATLRKCFAFCSIFSKDSKMKVDQLIQLWMALGLLHSPDPVDMEFKGREYFKILWWNSLFQDIEMDGFKEIRSCHMHDLVHDLARDVSKNCCLTYEDVGKKDVPKSISYLSLYLGRFDKIPEAIGESLGRLLAFHLSGEFFHIDDKILKKLKYLRILVLSSQKFGSLPSSIGKLLHLRYIDISHTPIKRLPDSISKLYLLETLRTQFLHGLPKSFRNLISLRYLCFEGRDDSISFEHGDYGKGCMFVGIKHLACLKVLPYFLVSRSEGCFLDELEGLNELSSTLNIGGLEDVENQEEAKKAGLHQKSEIQALELCWKAGFNGVDNIDEEGVLEGLLPHPNLKKLVIKNFMGKVLAHWMDTLENMVKIEIWGCYRCEQIPTLGQLPRLEELMISEMRNVKCIGMEFYGFPNSAGSGSVVKEFKCFPSLKKMTLGGMRMVEEWVEASKMDDSFSQICFPRLEVLEISNCPMLKRIPSQFPSLKCLTVGNMESAALEVMSRSVATLSALDLFEIGGSEIELVVEQFLRNNTLHLRIQIHGCPQLRKLRWRNNAAPVSSCNGSSKGISDVSFPSLRFLSLSRLEMLEEWEVDAPPSSSPSLLDSRSVIFPCLEVLDISFCPLLKRIPSHFPSLKELRFKDMDSCSALEEMSENVTTLTDLEFIGIGGSETELVLAQFFHNNTCLTSLDTGGLDELVEFPWPSSISRSLRSLRLLGWAKWKSLPGQLQHLSALTDLNIYSFDRLESVPDWLGSLSNLRELTISRCPKLQFLPSRDAMCRLRELQWVWISGCPLVKERCTVGDRPEWCKIQHVRTIHLWD